MYKTISESIGKGGYNNSVADVRTVQELLNAIPIDRRGSPPYPNVLENGRAGGGVKGVWENWNNTLKAIVAFQRANGCTADGRVDPAQYGGTTIVKMNKLASGPITSPTGTSIGHSGSSPHVTLSKYPISSFPRATTWHIVNTIGCSLSVGPGTVAHSRIWLRRDGEGSVQHELYFAGAGAGIGPQAIGFQIPSSSTKTLPTCIVRGLNTPRDFSVDELTGAACMIGGSYVMGTQTHAIPGINRSTVTGGSVSIVGFNCVPHSILAWIGSVGVMGASMGAGLIPVMLANSKAIGLIVSGARGTDEGISAVIGAITQQDYVVDVMKQGAVEMGKVAENPTPMDFPGGF